MEELLKELRRIQRELRAPKSQRNDFGKFNYRSCEDILEAVKPLLGRCVLLLTDEIVEVGDRVYVNANAQLRLGGDSISANGFAREAEEKKGMDSAQVTGSTSSYARKYALNGLFCIDDSRDSDAKQPPKRTQQEEIRPAITDAQLNELDRLIEVLGLPDDDTAKAVAWASGAKVQRIDQLDTAQAEKLVAFLKKKEAQL